MGPQNFTAPLTRLSLHQSDPHPCGYLPGRVAAEEYSVDGRIDSAIYQALLDRGFRRSGRSFYRPHCAGCCECVQIRVPVATFVRSRSQARAWRRNRDVTVEIGPLAPTDEKWALFRAYTAARHKPVGDDERAHFDAWLHDSPIDSIEFRFRIGGRLMGVGVVDCTPRCLSSVYFYFDPADGRRSPGVFSALCAIEECRRRGLQHWYAGYYVRDCPAMNYKSQYRPYELLTADGWRSPANGGA